MNALPDYYVSRVSEDRAAELRREADAFRLTRVLAEQHARLFPNARRLGAGITGLVVPGAARPRSARRSTAASRLLPTSASRTPGPCPC